MEDKYVGIITSASEDVDDYYKSIARTTANLLASMDYNLIYGGSSKSMMGICYDSFNKFDKKIYAVVTKNYEDELKKLDKAKPLVCETTFDLKKRIYENSDIIVMLPGGIGTFSEFFSFLEENRNRLDKVPIEIYAENGDNFFLPFIRMLQKLISSDFVDIGILDTFKISHNKEEFINHIYEYEKERRNKEYGK